MFSTDTLIELRYRNAVRSSEFSCLHSGLDEDFILLWCDTLDLNAEEVLFLGIYNLEDEVSRRLEKPGTDCTATLRHIPEELNAQVVSELEFAHKWTDITAYRKLLHV